MSTNHHKRITHDDDLVDRRCKRYIAGKPCRGKMIILWYSFGPSSEDNDDRKAFIKLQEPTQSEIEKRWHCLKCNKELIA